ncbi:hypothetical protein NGA_2075200, partial [Nannochloropsis gaditana CCMP526]|uniref:uncharacterized protein n=1 Tax=Nannochloropsis gaditana (strain CCMP526) TaxID=1093141 RepID=UPI00029F77AD
HGPVFRSRVVPGMGVTMAVPPVHRPLAVPVRRLNSVDLPTFGLPIKATRNGRVEV